MATGDDLLVFLYDDKGTPYGVFTVLGGVQQYFFYLYNAQGDVIAIIDDYAERVVNYEYSAWGELLSVTGSKADTVGVLNPFRYRGYCYDTETGLYYLNSRYYDPVTQRFVNGDGLLCANSNIFVTSIFAYCSNSPINCSDASGYADSRIPPYWELGGFKYDGSMRDFRRAEKGLPPLAYEQYMNSLKENDVGNRLISKDSSASNNVKSNNITSNNISAAQNLNFATISLGYNTLITAASSLNATTCLEAATMSGFGYLVTTPVNITLNWANPSLSRGQKIMMTSYELAVAAVGIAISVVLACAPVTLPIYVPIAAGLIYSCSTYCIGNELIRVTAPR